MSYVLKRKCKKKPKNTKAQMFHEKAQTSRAGEYANECEWFCIYADIYLLPVHKITGL